MIHQCQDETSEARILKFWERSLLVRRCQIRLGFLEIRTTTVRKKVLYTIHFVFEKSEELEPLHLEKGLLLECMVDVKRVFGNSRYKFDVILIRSNEWSWNPEL